MNLLKETEYKLKEMGLGLKDIKWFGSPEYGYCNDVKVFEKIADKEYNSGFGAAEVAEDLIIVGKDFWLSRGEYDGSEWWEEHSKHSIPKKPKKKITFSSLILEEGRNGLSCGWETLEKIDKAFKTK